MLSISSKKLLRRLYIAAGLILLIGAVAAFLLPRFISREMVREKIVYILSQSIAGTVTFQEADISVFPLPRVIIRNAGLTIPDKVSGTIRTVTIFPALRPLFRGEVRLAKMQIDEPSFTLRIPAERDDKIETLDEIVVLMRSLTLGAPDIRLSINHGGIVLEKPGRSPVSVKDIWLRAELTNTKDEVVLTIDRLSSTDPGMFLSGAFRVNPSANMIGLEAKGKGLDIPSVRHATLAFADDVPVLLEIFDILRGGTVEQISFVSSGSALADLGKAANMKIKGRLNKGAVMLSRLGLDFRDVSGNCDITEGILQGSELRGELMHSRISDGKLRIGLKGKDAPFQADAAVSADMKDVHAVLNRVVKDPEFHQELGHIRTMDGKAEGRLALGESLASVRAKVDITKLKFSVNYDRVPLPIAVHQGGFSYDDTGVAVKDLAGTIGTSAFSGLAAGLQTGDRAFLRILSGKGTINAAEVHRWLSSYEKLKALPGKITSVSGRFNLSSLAFQGLVMNSQNWDLTLSGTAEKLMITTPLLPGSLTVNSSKFALKTGQLTFSGAGVRFLDASPLISGSLNTSLENVRKADIRLSGMVGPKALQWIKTAFSIPEYIRTDQTIAVSDAHLTWQEKGETAFQGAMRTETGQAVVIELAKGLDRLTISRLELSDAVSKASFSIDLQEKKKQLSFKGRLDTSTAARIITTPQIQGGMVQGDISVGFSERGSSDIIAQGRLRGEKIVLPWKKDLSVMIDSVALNADRGSIIVDSARIRLGEHAVFLKGNATPEAGGVVVDLDISSDRIVWDTVMRSEGDSSRERLQSEKKKKPLNVQGVVRLKAERLDYQGFLIAPFSADVTLNTGRTDVKIGKSRVCGVATIGDISISSDKADPEIGIDLHFDASDQELKPTVTCLSGGRSDATGRFALNGHLKGRGRVEDLKKLVEGKVELIAKKGIIYRYKTLDTVLDFLNRGEELSGQMPDLDKSDLSYELLKVTASVGKGSLVVEEAIIDSALIEVVAQGSLNLMDNQLDLNVMVAPLRQMNKLIGKTPIIGDLLGDSVISVPVKVTGTPAEPKVTYLSPSAIASSLAGMMKRTLNLPVSILSPLFPKARQE
ncbi:MAG: AsmA-like C-terminal domain-containing protein [Nitrospirae bacterium]|nr:AsmA-like C-terminal domain-containing protein [Nitrospirota bacterium]